MISPRYAPAVCALLVLALVPTVIHVYAGAVVSDARRATLVPETLAGYSSQASSRPPDWGRRRFESDDWFERRYTSGADEVLLTVVRSYDLKALYHHPELAVAYGADYESSRVETFEPHQDVPVFVLLPRSGTGPAAFYVLSYDDEFVSRPILFQMRTAGELLFRGRRAMTLLFAQSPEGRATNELSKQPALTVLLAAVQAFVAPGPASR